MEQIKCQRCETVNEFYVEYSGPHIKAICNHCDRYIKFIKQEKLNKMATNISVNIDVTKIDKEKLFRADSGRVYLDAVLIMKEEPDQYGHCAMIVQSWKDKPKDVKGNILGNARWIQKKQETTPPSASSTTSQEPVDDLPF